MDTTRKLGPAKSTAVLFLLTKNKIITEYYVLCTESCTTCGRRSRIYRMNVMHQKMEICLNASSYEANPSNPEQDHWLNSGFPVLNHCVFYAVILKTKHLSSICLHIHCNLNTQRKSCHEVPVNHSKAQQNNWPWILRLSSHQAPFQKKKALGVVGVKVKIESAFFMKSSKILTRVQTSQQSIKQM